jgi:type II secretory pathway predicted ATPase ExeA
MYEAFYGLRERPFELTPNPAYLFMTPKHREALATLQYGLAGRKGFTVVIGEAGTGKTTLVNAALQNQRGSRPLAHDCIAFLNNPTLSPSDFIAYLAPTFGLSREAASSKASFLIELTKTVTDRNQMGGLTALIIDEAQNLPDALLEEIRLLANIETGSEKLLQIVLTGQPELADRLNQASLRQLKQRVALRCVLTPLDKAETGAYIAARIFAASASDQTLFTPEAIDLVYEASRGIPRTISVICDNSLVAGFALGERPVGRDTVLEVCQDFDLAPEPRVEFTRLPIRPSSSSSTDEAADGADTPLKALAASAPPEKLDPPPRPVVARDLFRAFIEHR